MPRRFRTGVGLAGIRRDLRSPPAGRRAAAHPGDSRARSAARRCGRTPAWSTMPASTGSAGSGVARTDLTTAAADARERDRRARSMPPPVGELGQHVTQSLLGQGLRPSAALIVGHDPGRDAGLNGTARAAVRGEQGVPGQARSRARDRRRRRAASGGGAPGLARPIGLCVPPFVLIAECSGSGLALHSFDRSTTTSHGLWPFAQSTSLKSSPYLRRQWRSRPRRPSAEQPTRGGLGSAHARAGGCHDRRE